MIADNIQLIDVFGNDDMVVNAARVSLDKISSQFSKEQNDKLIAYLATNNHWTPFSHPQVQFRVKVPIFVARQWVKSMIGTRRTVVEAEPFPAVNETSRRYVDDDPEFYEIEQFRMRPDKSIKQGSGSDATKKINEHCKAVFKLIHAHSLAFYKDLIANGIAPEQARALLPQTMMTQWIETGSLAYWARFCGLRAKGHAQKEIQEYAEIIESHMIDLFPVGWKALRNIK